MSRTINKRYYFYEGITSPQGKIYFSRVSAADEWDLWELRSFKFPYAEKLAKIKYGWKILGAYLTFRLFLENLWEKRHR
jgi:hypothetical protein